MIQFVLDHKSVPTIGWQLLQELKFSQDDFVEWVVFGLPAVDLEDIEGSMALMADDLYTNLYGFEPAPDWVEELPAACRTIWDSLANMVYPVINQQAVNNRIEYVGLETKAFNSAYVLQVHLTGELSSDL